MVKTMRDSERPTASGMFGALYRSKFIIPTMLAGAFVACGFLWRFWSAPSDANFVHKCLEQDLGETGPHADMVWVGDGTFEMGDSIYDEEGPVREVHVKGFWMDRHEVTNAEFQKFVEANNYVTVPERALDQATHPDLPADMLVPGGVVFEAPGRESMTRDPLDWWKFVPGANWRHPGGPGTDLKGRDEYPVVLLTYQDVQAYAKWKGRTLPTEAQWEWAARAGQPASDNREPPNNANTWQGIFPIINDSLDGFIGLAPVGCFEPNSLGLYDMIGNVWEWTRDTYRPPSSADSGVGLESSQGNTPSQVIKGGSYLCSSDYCMRYRAGSRQPQEQDLAVSHLGFRTILE